METKRIVTVDLLGERLTVRTTEPEEALRANVARINRVLAEIRAKSESVDSVRLFALGLLHLGRELRMLEEQYSNLSEHVLRTAADYADRVRRSLADG